VTEASTLPAPAAPAFLEPGYSGYAVYWLRGLPLKRVKLAAPRIVVPRGAAMLAPIAVAVFITCQERIITLHVCKTNVSLELKRRRGRSLAAHLQQIERPAWLCGNGRDTERGRACEIQERQSGEGPQKG